MLICAPKNLIKIKPLGVSPTIVVQIEQQLLIWTPQALGQPLLPYAGKRPSSTTRPSGNKSKGFYLLLWPLAIELWPLSRHTKVTSGNSTDAYHWWSLDDSCLMVSYFSTVQFSGSSTARYVATSPLFSLDIFCVQKMKLDKKGKKKSFVETCACKSSHHENSHDR